MIELLKTTMLIERLSGVFVYFIALLIMFLLLRKAATYEKFSKILNVYLAVLTVMAFFYIPESSADLSRWFSIGAEWVEWPFSRFFIHQILTQPTPVAYVLIYFCSFVGINGLLPAICSFIFHYNIFSIAKFLYKNKLGTAKTIALSLLFVMSMGRFLEAISGVRCLVALAILANCFIKEMFSENEADIFKKNIPFCLIAALMHLFAFAIYGLRILVFFFDIFVKKGIDLSDKKKIKKYLLIAGAIFLVLHRYIFAIARKAVSYLFTSKYYYFWEYLIAIIIFITIICVLVYLYKNRKDIKMENILNLMKLNVVFIVIELLCCYQYSIFHRTVTFSAILMMPLITHFLNMGEKNKRDMVIFIISMIILVLACARGDLCAYKFFLIKW